MDAMTVVRAMGESNAAEILAATEEPRTAAALSDALGIPIATVYRRLNTLTEAELVREMAGDATAGETEAAPTTYQRTLDKIQLAFEPETIELTVDDQTPD